MKYRLYKATVRPLAMYGSVTWSLTNKKMRYIASAIRKRDKVRQTPMDWTRYENNDRVLKRVFSANMEGTHARGQGQRPKYARDLRVSQNMSGLIRLISK